MTFVGRLHLFLARLTRLVAKIRPPQAACRPSEGHMVGWPDKLLIDFPDWTLDSAVDTSIDSPIQFSIFP
jgi:hypothetical protein